MAEEPTLRQDTSGDYNASAQGGGNATVNVTYNYAGTAGPVSPAFRGIVGLPPPTDSRTIEQRASLVEAVYARLLQPGLNTLVLTGIGGVGKSTLAALLYHSSQAQHGTSTSSFAVPPLWLSIDRITTFADMVGTLFQALGKPIPELGSLSPSNQAAALFSLLDTHEVPCLVVLDQFENLLDWTTGFALSTKAGVGEWLDALNGQCWRGGSRMLLTSRLRPKGTRAFPPTYLQEYPVEGLSMAEGLDLLRKRGVQAPERDLRSAVSACNGHALSLTLLIALVEEYGISLTSLLTDPALWEGDIATNLLDAIFQQLSEVQRDILRACSVFRIPVPVEAISALLGTPSTGEMQRAIRALLTQHLIQRVEEGQYQVHAIVASYARQHLVERDEPANRQALQEAHAQATRFYLHQAENFCPPREQRRRVSEVQPFIEAVWHDTQAGQWQEAYRVIEQEGLFGSLRLWGANVLVLELCQLLLPRANWQPAPDQEATLYVNLGAVYDVLGKKPEALDYYRQALAIRREVGDRRGEGVTLYNLGRVYNSLGQKPEALDYFQQALVISREVGDRGREGRTLSNLGRVYDSLGKKSEALDYYQQALVISREVGDRRGEGVTLNNLGLVYNSLGQKPEALDYYQQALAISCEVGDRRGEGRTLNSLGGVYDSLGKKPEALDYYQQALPIYREVGDRGNEGVTLWNIGAALFQQQHDVSLAAFLLAKYLFQEVQSPYQNNVQSWINSLRHDVGEEQFALLVTRVEPHAQQVLEQFLNEKRNE